MAKDQKKNYDDDDGRSIADMSGVTRPNLWSFRFPSSAPWHKAEAAKARAARAEAGEAPGAEKKDPFEGLSKQDRRAYILAAVGGALGIAAVFGVVFALFIILIGHFGH